MATPTTPLQDVRLGDLVTKGDLAVIQTQMAEGFTQMTEGFAEIRQMLGTLAGEIQGLQAGQEELRRNTAGLAELGPRVAWLMRKAEGSDAVGTGRPAARPAHSGDRQRDEPAEW